MKKSTLIRIIVFALVLSLGIPATVSAKTNVSAATPLVSKWTIESKKNVGTVAGSWKTLDSAYVTKKNIPLSWKASGKTVFSMGLTGSIKISYKVISAALGFNVSSKKTYASSLTKVLKSMGTWKFKVRPNYYKYKLVQRKWIRAGGGKWKKTNTTAVAYAYKYAYPTRTILK